MKISVIATVCAAGLVSGSALAQSQQQPQQPPPPPPPQQQAPQMPQQQTVDISDADLQKFAEIYLDVQTTRDKLSGEMSGTESQEEAQEIQARMHDAIVQTIEGHGWSVNQYNQIATAISSDPDMRETALAFINDLSS